MCLGYNKNQFNINYEFNLLYDSHYIYCKDLVSTLFLNYSNRKYYFICEQVFWLTIDHGWSHNSKANRLNDISTQGGISQEIKGYFWFVNCWTKWQAHLLTLALWLIKDHITQYIITERFYSFNNQTVLIVLDTLPVNVYNGQTSTLPVPVEYPTVIF